MVANRYELKAGQVWVDHEGYLLRLDRSVPGDGSAWYADVWMGGHWSHEDCQIEPSDLIERAADPAEQVPA